MTGLNISFGSSVLKREAKPIEDVEKQFRRDGWTKTSEVLGGRLVYLQKTGVNITLISGPLGTAVIPSGPVRGKAFGNVDFIARDSVIGAGGASDSDSKMATRDRSPSEGSTKKTL